MATAKRTTTAPKKATTAKKAPAATTTRPRAPRKTAKTIRNLRGTQVHARLLSQNPKDPFRITLQPRGQQGDTDIIPVSLLDDRTFLDGIDVLWEVITATEAQKLQSEYAPIGYLGDGRGAKIIRPQDTTITTQDDWDGKPGSMPERRTPAGKQASEREFGTGMHTVDVPGSDDALHAKLKAAVEEGNVALPEGVDIASRRVSIERTRG